jgi:hypothetical protein
MTELRLDTLPKVEPVDTMPQPAELPNGTRYGTFSVLLPSGLSLVPYHNLRTWEGYDSTETGFTRAFLKSLPKVWYKKPDRQAADDSHAPLIVRPSYLRDSVYIDIRAAFPSLYRIFGWNGVYRRNKFLSLGEPLKYPFPETWKIGRSYVVTGARPHAWARYIKDGKILTKRYYNRATNPYLVNFVNDTLSAVARAASYAFGAVYWCVDGGIFPRRTASEFMQFLSYIGLDSRVKYEGTATVLSSGYWKVGAHETVLYKQESSAALRQADNNPMTKDEAEKFYLMLAKKING